MWEYFVTPEHTKAFLDAYCDSGAWVQLFRRAPGYIRTELHQDGSQPQRYVTIDYWESEAACKAFRSEFSREFEDLDAKGESWTAAEREIGRFQCV